MASVDSTKLVARRLEEGQEQPSNVAKVGNTEERASKTETN
jgi:hypothetical protein